MLTLIRDVRVGNAILGRLSHNGGFICWTLENAAKAIPMGRYSLQNSVSTKFKRELPLIYNETTVKASRGVRIHAGNSAKDSNACVLVGMVRDCSKGTISESKQAETMVTMLCRNVTEFIIVDAVG